jgi:GT2 family glycosyltransferase
LITQARYPDLIDGTGDVYNISGNAWKRGYGYPIGLAPQKPERIFSPNAAAAFYRRDVFMELGGFDEDFFSYFEDVDLGFRLNLAGYQCFFLPSLRVEHVGSSSTGQDSDFAVYHHHRNSEWVFWKNMPGILFFIYFPFHLLGNIVFFLKYLKNGRGKIVCKAKLDALKHLRPMVEKRRAIQKHRRASIPEINRILNKQVLAPYLLGYSLRKFNKAHNVV